jgi:hypothetical protein
MKLIALAAALAIGGTAVAQDMPQQSTSTPSTSTPTSTTTTTTTDSTMSTSDQTMPGTTGAGRAMPDGTMDDPKGGYMPSTPALSGTPMPGQQVIFQQSKTPAEAYPAPAPLKSYPICKKGQYDNCRQRGG